MALQMYALVRVRDLSKVTESRETTHLNNGNESWVPIVYEEMPIVDEDHIAERVEGLDGAVWRKSWTVRDKAEDEKAKDRAAKKLIDRRNLRESLEDVVYRLATGGSVADFVAEYERINNQ